MWLYNQRVIYICICLCSDNCFRTDQTRLGYYDVTARLTLMIDLLSLLFINDLKDWFVSANYILWFTVGCRWSLFEIWRIECKQKGSKLNCYLVPPYISVKFDWGLGVSVVCTALRSDSDPCLNIFVYLIKLVSNRAKLWFVDRVQVFTHQSEKLCFWQEYWFFNQKLLVLMVGWLYLLKI